MKQITILLLIIFFTACQSKTAETSGELDENGLYYIEGEDASMNDAITKAQSSLDKFDEAIKNNNGTLTDFAVKKRYATDEGGEHIWVAGISIVNGRYKGFINNDVERANKVKYGDTVFVEKNEITDWMYLDNNILKGGYTIKEIRNNLSKEEKEKMDFELGFKIVD